MADPTVSHSRDYRAHLSCSDRGRWMPAAVDQVASWLREKHLDIDLDSSGDHARPGASLAVRRLSDRAAEDFTLKLVEQNDTGEWTTELHAHDDLTGSGWITLSVSSKHGGFVSVPRLARYLMQVLRLSDASIEFADGHQMFHLEDVERLMTLLADPTRHGLVFVAGTTDGSVIPVPAFAKKVGDWGKEVYGLAQVIVLDPAATREFEARVGKRFAAPAWTIRTYQPGVEFGALTDARRHRILGTDRLGNQPDHVIRRLLGDIARQQAATRPVDPAVLRARRRLERLENRRLLEALEPVAPELPEPPAPEMAVPPEVTEVTADALGEELALARRILGLGQLTEEALTEIIERGRQLAAAQEAARSLRDRVEVLQGRGEELEDSNASLRQALEDSQMEAEMARMDVDVREARIRWLTARLKDHQDFAAEHSETPADFLGSRPASFDDLLRRIEQFEEVEFTGDVAEVERLNQIDTNDAALRTAWEAVVALRDYVRSRADGACNHGLDHYLAHTPHGYQTFPVGKFAETETSITMKGYGKERIFPVPTSVAPQGKVAMKAHFKLARIGMASPRMHVYDGHPQAQKVFIGYIGAHLTNTQTN